VVFWTGVLSYVNLAGAIHALAQALLLWVVPRGNRRANRIMAAFLLVLATGMSHGVASLAGVYETWPALGLLMGILPLLYGPLFLFYVRAIAEREARWHRADALHALPFVLGLVAYGVSWHSGGPVPDWRVFDSIARAPWQIVLVLTILQAVVYVRWIRRLLRRHAEGVASSYSTIDKVTLGWLQWRLTVFAVIWAAGVVMMAAVAFEPRAIGLAVSRTAGGRAARVQRVTGGVRGSAGCGA
jgi:hypothetical protein